MTQNRQPRGIPAGGEFAANQHDEAGADLEAFLERPELPVEEQYERTGQQLRLAGLDAVRKVALDCAEDFKARHPEVAEATFSFETDLDGQGQDAVLDSVKLADGTEVDIYSPRWDLDWHDTFRETMGDHVAAPLKDSGNDLNRSQTLRMDRGDGMPSLGTMGLREGYDRAYDDYLDARDAHADSQLRAAAELFTAEFPDVHSLDVASLRDGYGEPILELEGATLDDGAHVTPGDARWEHEWSRIAEGDPDFARAMMVRAPGETSTVEFSLDRVEIDMSGNPIPANLRGREHGAR